MLSAFQNNIPKFSSSHIYFTQFHTLHIPKLQNLDRSYWVVAMAI